MRKIFYSPVVAAAILSIGLISSALIVSRAKTTASSEWSPSEQDIKAQFVSQMTEQTGSSPIVDMTGNKRRLSEIVIDEFQMSPRKNRVDIDYHFAWQNTKICTFTKMSLTKDEFGRFDSGDVSGMLDGSKHFRVVVQ